MCTVVFVLNLSGGLLVALCHRIVVCRQRPHVCLFIERIKQTVCLSVCLSISIIETQTLRYISNTKYKQSTEFSFSLMQTTLVVSIVYVLIFFSREDTCQLVEDDSSVASL